MKIVKIWLLLALLCINFGCVSNYIKLDTRINGVLAPKDIFDVATDIQLADVSDADKRKLNIKLAKRTLKIAELYLKTAVNNKKLSQKEEILDIIKSLSKMLDDGGNEELTQEITKMIKQFTLMLLKGKL